MIISYSFPVSMPPYHVPFSSSLLCFWVQPCDLLVQWDVSNDAYADAWKVITCQGLSSLAALGILPSCGWACQRTRSRVEEGGALIADAWVSLSRNQKFSWAQPKLPTCRITSEINADCFKLLSVGVICYAAKANHYRNKPVLEVWGFRGLEI